MKRPRVSLENYGPVYDFYENYRQPRIAKYGYIALGHIVRPIYSVSDQTRADIANHMNERGRAVLVINHLTDDDQYTVAATVHCVKQMRPLRANTIIPAKESLFREDTALKWMRRRPIDGLGGIPTFREKDMFDANEDKSELRKKASEALLDLCATKLATYVNFAAFTEGERNVSGDFTTVQELKLGTGNIIVLAQQKMVDIGDEVPLAIIPLGIMYGEKDGKKKSFVKVGAPITDLPLMKTEVPAFMQGLRLSMQDEVDDAVDLCLMNRFTPLQQAA